MEKSFKVVATSIAICLTAGLTQSSKGQSVAYVYVAGSTQISGYSATASGQLAPIPGLPIPASVSHLSTTSKTLFGPGIDNENIYSFNIGVGGLLTPGPVTYAQQYNTNGCPAKLGPTQIDYTGLYLYSLVIDAACSDATATEVYPIRTGGALGEPVGWFTQIEHAGPPNPIRILGTNKFGFFTGCEHDGSDFTPTTLIFQISGGWLTPDGRYTEAPEPSDPEDFYCPAMLTGDPSNHLAFAFRKYYPSISKLSTPYFLASYTVDTQGNISTESNYTNMPTASIGTLSAMSIAPSGNLLVVAGSYGFELFAFNGASPITKIGSLVPSNPVTQMAWDKAGHLYVLTTSSLFVYTATSTGVKEAAGSPYTLSGSGPFSIIALSLKH
jgi:hypothetical protein